ncbi:hypothetical protein GCM10028822_04150 [Hymenobacter terrigena]
MKNWFLSFATGAAILLAVGSCKKDESQAVLGANAAPQLTASATTATINRNDTSPAVTYSWKPADFNYPAAITYTLQFAKAGTNFATTVDYNVGNALTKSFNQTELNDVYNSLDCTLTPVPTALDVRVKSSVGDAAAAQMSASKTITATPYLAVTLPNDQWGLVGPAGDGWPGATATDRMMPYDCKVRAFVQRMALNAGAFKFRRNQDWSINLGGVTGDYTKGVALTKNGADLVITTPGTYTVKLEVNRDAAGMPVDGKVTITP